MEFEGHDTNFRRSVELLCMPRTLHSRLRVFSMTLLGRINLDSTQLKLLCGGTMPHSIVPVVSRLWRAMGAFAVLHPRYRPFVTNSFTRDFCDC